MCGLAGCATPLKPAAFTNAGPAFNPLKFFTGHVTSWGVEEARSGQPIAIVTTDCTGTATGPNRIRMVQVLHVGNAPPQTRIWQFKQTGPHQFIATANDMSGTARGTAGGPEFHWHWVLESHPGNPLENITMAQWMYEMPDGSVVIRTVASKLGIRLVEVTEQFRKTPVGKP